jgi:hypothetical protein
MSYRRYFVMRCAMALIAGFAAMFSNGKIAFDPKAGLISVSEARIGRPRTPMSYAGVARRTVRRSVVVRPPVYVRPPVVVAPRPVYVAPAVVCRQVVNAYGQIVRICR